MRYNHPTISLVAFGVTLLFFLGFTQPLYADIRGGRPGPAVGHQPGNSGWKNPAGAKTDHKGIRGGTIRSAPQGNQRHTHRDWYRESRRGWDTRYHHNRYYPARGHYVRALPHGYHTVYYARTPYYVWHGVWYRPYGTYFTIVAPPVGLVIPFLPPFYTTLWVGGSPYYYANETYYTHYPRGGYVVSSPPPSSVSETAPESDWLYSYPNRGQSESQQADDRYACHRWAMDQTGYDPMLPLGGVPESEIIRKRNDYQRALGACMEARGYTVR